MIKRLLARLQGHPDFVLGQRVRLADMNGCMAHRRENVREGTITSFWYAQVYGDTQSRRYARVTLASGRVETRCLDRHLWILHDGLMEYRD